MSRLFTSSSSEYLERTGAVGGTYPFSVLTRVKPTTIGSAQTIWSTCTAGSNDHFFSLDIAASGVARTAARGTSNGFGNSNNAAVAGQWHAICGVYSASNNRSVFLDYDKGVTSNPQNPSGMDRTAIGRRSTLTGPSYANGAIAEVVVYNVALTDAEVFSYVSGASPLLVRPTALVSYWSCRDATATEPDFVGGHDLAATGTARAENPSVYYPVNPLHPVIVSVGGGDQTVEATGIASTVLFGSPTVAPGPVTIQATGIESTTAFGSPTILQALDQTISATGIASTVLFGRPRVSLEDEVWRNAPLPGQRLQLTYPEERREEPRKESKKSLRKKKRRLAKQAKLQVSPEEILAGMDLPPIEEQAQLPQSLPPVASPLESPLEPILAELRAQEQANLERQAAILRAEQAALEAAQELEAEQKRLAAIAALEAQAQELLRQDEELLALLMLN